VVDLLGSPYLCMGFEEVAEYIQRLLQVLVAFKAMAW